MSDFSARASIGADDERPHPAGSDARWCELYRFDVCGSGEAFGGRAELALRPSEGAMEAALHFFLPDGGLVATRHVAALPRIADAATTDAGATLVLEAGEVRCEMIEPLRRWRILYDGPSHALLSAEEAGEPQAWRKSRLERLTVELDFDAVHPAIPTDEDAARGYDQPGHLAGVVWVSGDRYEVAASGLRVRSWGIPGRAAADFSLERTFTVALDGDRIVRARRVGRAGGETDDGWSYRDGRVYPLAHLEIATRTDVGSFLQRAIELAASGGDSRDEIEGTVLAVAPLRSSRNGIDTLDCDSLVRFECAGRSAIGLASYVHRLASNTQPVAPVR